MPTRWAGLGVLALIGLGLACARVCPVEPLPAGSGEVLADGAGRQRLAAPATQAVTWRQAPGSFPARDGHATVVFQGRLWVLGGWGTGPLADVWSSADGVEWREVLHEAPWEARRGHAAVVFGGRIWVLGGSLGAARAQDVWASADGRSWERIVEAAPWGPRNEHSVVAHRGRLWLLGGWNGGNRNDVWSSPDGRSWRLEVAEAPWIPRNGLAAVSFRDRLWVLGGWGLRPDGGEGNLGDAWSSADGSRWQQADPPSWSPRTGHAAVVHGDRLWVLGGWADRAAGEADHGQGNVDDVWSTRDGQTWSRVTCQASWPPRSSHTAAAFNDRLWILAGWGREGESTSTNDLWYSFEPTGGR